MKESDIKQWCSINGEIQYTAFNIAKKYYEIMEVQFDDDYAIEAEFYDVCLGKDTISIYMTVRNKDEWGDNYAQELVIPYSDFCGDYEAWIRTKMADTLKEKEDEKKRIEKQIRDERLKLYLKLKEEFGEQVE